MEPDGDSADSIESFFSSLQSSEHSPRNLSQIFEDDLRPMQRESRNLRYQPGGHRAQQKPQKPQPPPPTTSPAVSSERNSVVAVVEKTPSRWSVAFAKIVNIYNGYHPAERMCLALTMLGENEAATMILYKQKTQTISNTKLKPHGKTVHLRDNYVQFYDDTRKYWSLRFVQKADEEGFVETMTTNGWPLEQHSSRSEDDVEQQQEEEEEEHSSGSQQDVEHPQQNTEQLRDPTEELRLSDLTSEQFQEQIEQKQQQLREQLRDQLMERLNREQLERNERYGKLHSEQNQEQRRKPNREQLREQNREELREPNRDQNREQLREQNREQLREQNREQLREQNREQLREQQDLRNREQRVEQIREQLRQETRELRMEQNREQLRRENPAEHQEPRRHTCHHHRHSRNNEEHPEVPPPQPMPRSRNLATSQDEPGEKSSTYMECLRRHFMHLGCQHMPSARGQIPEEDLSSERMQSVREQIPEEDLSSERMESGREQISEEDLSSERMQSGREQISEEDVIVTPMSIPIGSTSSRTSMEHDRSNSSAVVQLPARRAETTNSSSRLLTKFINTHMGPGEIAEMKIQNILDAMQRLSEGRHGRNFNGNHDEDAPPQPQPRPSSSKEAEDAEDRVLQLEQSLLDAKKENRRLSKELKMRDDDLVSFQKSSLALMEKLVTTNEDLEAKNSRLVETIIITKSKAKASKKENCINCERSAQEIVVLKRHINALELALRESE